MDWQNILFVTGLLTLLTLSNAGGDHIKGGGHIKGGSETVQHPVIQEEIAPSTHNFNTKSSDAYGTKVLHTKTGDEVISPSNAKVGVITKTVLGAPPHPLQSQDAVFLSGKTSLVAPIRDPVAHPVATEQTRKTVANPLETQPAGVKVARRKIIKTIRRKPEATAQVKTIQPVQQQVPTSLSEDDVQIVLPDSKKVAPAPKPITKTVKTSTKSKINRSPLITIDGSENDAGREVIVLEDGTIVDAKDTSRLLGQTASLVPDGGIRQGSTQTINQDFKMVRGSQIPRSDIRPNFESRNPYTDFGLNIEAAAAPPVGSPELLEPIVVPGGPGGASLTLTETEIQNILLSGGIVEFPVNSQGSFPADTAGAPLAGIVRTAQTGETTRSNVQSVSQVSPARKPTLNVRPIDQKRTEFKSQTATVTSSSRGASVSGLGGSGGSVVVPGGAGGASFSLTEDEIQKILSSGGIVEFPAGTPSGVPGTGLSTAYRGGVTTMRSNAQAVSQTSSARKPTVNVRPIDLKRTEFKSQTATVTSSSRGASVSGLGGSGGSVVVPGGPGGASFSLTENEIQKILSSGGIVEFPAGTPSGVPGAGVSTAYGGGATTMRSNAQAVSQTSSARKPTVNVRPIDQKRTEFKSQTARVTSSSRGASVSSLGVRGGSVVVPGGPGGASFSLTEDEIQKILSSGGIVEFPAGTPSGVPGAGLSTAYGGGATTMRSNAQAVSQTSSARKPTVNVRPIDQKRTEFKSQTATVTSGSRGASVSSLGVRGGSVVVPGGPGGASFSLTEDEIQKILSSGGIVEFPAGTPSGVSGAGLSTAYGGGATTMRSNAQAVSQTSSARKPTVNVRPIDQKRTEFKSQTATVTSGSRGASVSSSGVRGGSVVVPGGPGGASFSLTEDEIQKILSSGGIVEFPAGTPSGVPGAGLSTAYRGGVTTMRSNAQAVSQTSSARKPTVNVRPIDLKRTEFKSQTATVTSGSRGASVSGLGVRGGSVVVPGGPGGASFSLTEDEIQKILSSGGIVEFPAGTPSGVPGAGLSTAYQGGVTTMRSNAQAVSQTSSARKPTVNVRPIDQKRTEFKSQTATVTSSSRGASVSGLGGSGGSVVVPGGPEGASFSLTENEIQKILSSGGIVEFPAGTPSGVPGAGLSTAYGGGATTMRSNAQAVSQTSSARKPTVNARPIDQKRTEFKSQTATVTSGSRGASVSSLGVRGGSVVVPGGPGGASFSLTEDEIQKILSSGGIVEFPAGTPSGVPGAGLSTAYGGGATTMRSNAQAVSQTSSARKPTVNVRPIDLKRTEFKSQTATVTSGSRGASVSGLGVRGGSVVVPGGPGGASFSLTEDEIQKILSSGGVVEFPSNTPLSTPGIRDSLLKETRPVNRVQNDVSSLRSNVQSLTRASAVRKPTSGTSDSSDRKRMDLKSQTSTITSNARRTLSPNAPISGGPIIVSGGPGGSSLTLSEEEINRILESGGVVEFPVDAPAFSSGDLSRNIQEPSRFYSGEDKQVFATRGAQGASLSVGSGAANNKLNSGQVHLETVFSETDPSLSQDEIKPAFAQGPEFSQQKFTKEQVPNLLFKEGDVQLHQASNLANSPIAQALVADSNDKQTQLKLEDPLEQKPVANDAVLSQFRVNPLTLEKRLVLDNLSSKYLQEKVPVEVPGYVPPPSHMSPFNYRVPHLKGLKSTTPVVQEQQRMEQILV